MEQKQSDQEIRRSQRGNAGVPPARFGYTPPQGPRALQGTQNQNPPDSSSEEDDGTPIKNSSESTEEEGEKRCGERAESESTTPSDPSPRTELARAALQASALALERENAELQLHRSRLEASEKKKEMLLTEAKLKLAEIEEDCEKSGRAFELDEQLKSLLNIPPLATAQRRIPQFQSTPVEPPATEPWSQVTPIFSQPKKEFHRASTRNLAFDPMHQEFTIPSSGPSLTTPQADPGTLAVLKILAESQQKQTELMREQWDISNSQFHQRGLGRFRDLPIFGGDPDDWPKFIADYNNSTAHYHIAEIDNLHRLEKALKGKAKELVKSHLSYPHMVGKIIEILERRFGRPEFIIDFLIQKVRSHKRIREDQINELLDFASEVDNLTVSVEKLNQYAHLSNPQLIKELELKLPMALMMSWGKFNRNWDGIVTLRDFSDWLMDETSGLVRFYHFAKKREEEKPKRARPVGHIDQDTPEQVLTIQRRGSQNPSPCETCGRSHPTEHCMQNKTVAQRWDIVKRFSLCAKCLMKGHVARECKRGKCPMTGCGRDHHSLLHPTIRTKETSEPPNTVAFVKDGSIDSKNPPERDFEGRVILKMAPVILSSPTKSCSTFAFLDPGSKITMVEEGIAKSLGATGRHGQLNITWVGGKRMNVKTSLVTLKIRGESRKDSFTLRDVHTFPNLNLFTQSISQKDLERWRLDGKGIQTYSTAKPGILIGADYAHLFHPEHSENGSPVAEETKLGWVVSGPGKGTPKSHSDGLVGFIQSLQPLKMENMKAKEEGPSPSTRPQPLQGMPEKRAAPEENQSAFEVYCTHKEEDFQELVKDFFMTDNFAVSPPKKVIQSKENERAMTILEKTTRRVDGAWETGLLWKEDHPVLPNNYQTALKRLTSVERKMDTDPKFAEKYREKISEYLTKGFAKKLQPDELGGNNIWYLPHFRHINPKKPEKFRLVFDAAAKTHGVSLNSFLLKGPDLYKPLPEVLVKFREHRYGFTADIKDMFHKVKVIERDLPSQRFLWRGMDRTNPPDIYQMQVMVFGAACSPASAHFVKNRNAERFAMALPKAADAIIHKHYVDDYLDSVDTIEEARERIRDVTKIHNKGGFEICNWIASDSRALEGVPYEHHAQIKKFSLTENYTERVLGLYWDPEQDIFTFTKRFVGINEELVNGEMTPTKREVLKILASIFDPVGYIEHFRVKAKIIFQATWTFGIGWDDKIPESLSIKWKAWLRELNQIDTLKIPRCYEVNVNRATNVYLHVFVDAGEPAYAAVAYFAFEFPEQSITTALVMAISRVAPVKPQMSIPRLELQAAVLGARVAKAVKEMHNYKIDEIHFWSDSSTVLKWLRSEARKFKPFVAHRISEVEETTQGAAWHWVPGKLNPADLATKDSIPSDLSPESVWFQGPEFIKGSRDEWPKESEEPHLDRDSLELKRNEDSEEVFTIIPVEPHMKWGNFSNWQRLINTIAYVKRVFKKKGFKRAYPRLTVFEKFDAGEQIWRWVQMESFTEEVQCLMTGKSVPHTSRLYSLTPFLDSQGLVRMQGRLDRTPNLQTETKCPIILDPRHPAVKLLISHYHKTCRHQGQETVLNELRSQYWILGARSAVRRAFRECRWCQLQKPIPLHQEMGQLPAERVTKPFRAFMHVGLDYFGPMEVTVGRRHEKRWGALFTCMATRAVHLELADFLTTDSAIMALRRFIARRGTPTTISSDNGTNFHGADNELQLAMKEIDAEKMEAEATTKGIVWKFIPPSAPHMGGVWERLVQSVKVALKNTLKERAPKQEILHTLLVEAENIVNSRPLTYVSSDPKDTGSLTPNHFLIGSSNGGRIPGEFEPNDIWLKKQWRAAQALADEFWGRWIKEYLPTLNKRNKWYEKGQQLKIGDLVFIADGDLPRGTWPKGLVTAVFPGKDNQVRVVEVKTANGRIYKRPIAKILSLAPEI